MYLFFFFLSHDNKIFKTKIKLFLFIYMATLQKKKILFNRKILY